MISEALMYNQTNLITFVMVDATYTEVAGLGGAFTSRFQRRVVRSTRARVLKRKSVMVGILISSLPPSATQSGLCLYA